MALNMYAQDNDGKLPLASTNQQNLKEFTPNLDWQSLNPRGGQLTFNKQIAGLTLEDLPKDTILTCETTAWPDGRIVVALANFQVKSLAESDSKRWRP